MTEVKRTVGRYELLEEIGRGGMATVYLARQTGLSRLVALKELSGSDRSDPSFGLRFERESQLIAALSHPNVVVVFDYFEDEGSAFIAMEHVSGGTLRPHVRHLTLAQAAGVLEGLLAGLAHAEVHGIVHRDLKPENVMLTGDGRVKIADFGIAKVIGAGTHARLLTATGMTVGTPLYMAPEQAMAQDVGPWTDLYSLGAIAYEMLCGRPPIAGGDSLMAILLRVLNETPVPLRAIVPSLDPALSDWVARLLEKEPARRTQSAAQAWDELEDIVISVLGPRWRKEARLQAQLDAPGAARPLTPAPFESSVSPWADGLRAAPATPQSGFVTFRPPRQVSDGPSPPPDARPPDARAAEPASLLVGIGDVIDDFEILEVVASGASSTTYRAGNRALARDVAWKFVHPGVFAGDPAGFEAARADAIRVARLEHPAIAPVFAAGRHRGGLYVASAMPKGSTLAQLSAERRIAPADTARVLADVAAGLAEAHAQSVVHRDLRPDCITVDRWGHGVLRDFGVTRASGRTVPAGRDRILESLRYTAPEVVLGEPATPASDVFGLAAVAVCCLTGSPPYRDRPAGEYVVFRTIAPVPVLVLPDGTPASQINMALTTAMAHDPARRPGPVAFAGALADAVAALPADVRAAGSPLSSQE